MAKKTDDWHMFVWKIENFSYCWHKNNEYISSPTFSIEGCWSLQIFPRGKQGYRDYISCYIKRESPMNGQVQFKLSCIYSDGISGAKWISRDGKYFQRNVTDGCACFESRKAVFEDRMKFLPNDTLTVCCHISSSYSYNLSKILARTHIEAKWQTIEHKIRSFNYINSYTIERINIPSESLINFTAAESTCSDINLNIEIFFEKNECRKFSTCSVFILDATGTKLKCGKSDIWFDPDKADQNWKFPLIFTKWELLAKKDSYLPNDTLSLLFECSSSLGISDEGIVSYNATELSELACSELKNTRDASALDDLGSLLRESILSDVNLQTSTKTFPAHKAILSARSPVFKAMFTNDMKEKTINNVDIEDLDEETIRRLLLYIYTNTVENLQWQAGSQLYVAADKYSVESLKKKCSLMLIGNLSPLNVCEILELADRHHDDYLKISIRDYILRADEDIIGSEKWKNFALKSPQLTFETMCSLYKKERKF